MIFLLQDEQGVKTLVNLALAFEIKPYTNSDKEEKNAYMKEGLLVIIKDEAMDDANDHKGRKNNRMSKDIHCHRVYYGLSFDDLVRNNPIQIMIPDHLAPKPIPEVTAATETETPEEKK